MKVLTNQINQFVSVLAGRGNADGSGPVVVHVGELVSQLLHVVSFEIIVSIFFQHHKVGWSDCSLGDALWNQKEILEISSRDGVVQNGAGRGIFQVCTFAGEDPGVDSFLNDNEVESGVVILGHFLLVLFTGRGGVSNVLEGLHKLGNLKIKLYDFFS